MSQHFLLSAKARTLSLKAIWRMSDDQAFETFKAIRFAENDGEAFCPSCGCGKTYWISTRKRWKCAACLKTFSVTSGTIFASRKMSFGDLLAAICIFVNAVKGISALQMARDLDCQHKTAFVLCHKLREAMAAEIGQAELNGVVEIDGAWFGGSIRQSNRVENRVDRRLKRHQTGKRRSVIVMRERRGRTVPFVAKHESDAAVSIAYYLAPTAEIHADEASHWDGLEARFPMRRIDHSKAFSDDDACTNQAESYFSRLRRAVTGQHHHVSPQYLYQYANEAAWREDNRREDNGSQARMALGRALHAPISRTWKGYWQRSAA